MMTLADTTNALFNGLTSHAQNLGVFERVYQHEPKSAPGRGLTYAVWFDSMRPVPAGSGLNAVSTLMLFKGYIYKDFVAKPEDRIDPEIVAATAVLFGEYAGHFTLDGQVRDVDLFGAHGQGLDGTAGYIAIDDKHYRVMQVTLPLIVNDLWTEAA